MCHPKQKGTKSCAEWHLWALTGEPTSISPIHVAFFAIFTEIRFLTLLFFYPRDSVRSPDVSKTYINDKTFKYIFYEIYT